jgi:ADP-ribose pyrophosphatase YjhB (NUDIX family)
MAYCFHCGGMLVRQQLADDLCERDVCNGCNHVHYDNPKILVWCLPYWRDHVVLCRRAIPPAVGLWAPASGFVEMGETLEEAAARETLEETGLVLQPASLILLEIMSVPHMNQIFVGFRTPLDSKPQLTPGPEVSEARLWSGIDYPLQQLAFADLVGGSAAEFARCLRAGAFPPPRAVTVRCHSPAD